RRPPAGYKQLFTDVIATRPESRVSARAWRQRVLHDPFGLREREGKFGDLLFPQVFDQRRVSACRAILTSRRRIIAAGCWHRKLPVQRIKSALQSVVCAAQVIDNTLRPVT